MKAHVSERELARTLARVDRRGFLRLTGAVAAVGFLPTGCGQAPAGWRPPATLDLAVLTPRTFATLEAAADRLLGPAARARRDETDFSVAARADARLAGLPELAGLVQQALLALEFGVWPLVPKLRPFSSLDASAREAVLRELSTARFDLSRALFQGIRSFTWLAWFGSDAGHGILRYPGPFGGPGESVDDAMTYDVRLGD